MWGNIIKTPPHCPHVMYIFVFTMFVPCCCCLPGTLQHELLLSARFRKTRRYTNVVCCEVLLAQTSKTGRYTNGLLLPEDPAFGAKPRRACSTNFFQGPTHSFKLSFSFPRFVACPLELGLGTHNPRFVAWPLELGLGTHNPRFVAWPLELGLGTHNPCFVVWPLELGLGTHNPRFVAWPLELGLGTHNPRFVEWPLELGLGDLNPRFVVWPLELGLGTHNPRFGWQA